MKTSLKQKDLVSYVASQIKAFFPDGSTVKKACLQACVGRALERLEHCLSKIAHKYSRQGQDVLFDHLNGDQYAAFLYFLNNEVTRKAFDVRLCSKIYLLNKALHGLDLFYEVQLPDIFSLTHPLGTVLGRATYADYLLVYQGCNVGSNKNIYPVLGEYVCLHPGSSVLGNCHVGNNCRIAAGSLLLDQDLADDSVYIGSPRQHLIKRVAERHPLWQKA